jgi:hypothetical protein
MKRIYLVEIADYNEAAIVGEDEVQIERTSRNMVLSSDANHVTSIGDDYCRVP